MSLPPVREPGRARGRGRGAHQDRPRKPRELSGPVLPILRKLRCALGARWPARQGHPRRITRMKKAHYIRS